MGPKYFVSVAAVITLNEKVLVIRRNDTKEWQIPGGLLELNEFIQEGLKREIFEETGVSIEIERLSGIYNNLKLGAIGLVFRCNFVAGELTTSSETDEVIWGDLREMESLMNPTFYIRIIDALEKQDKVPLRNHNGVIIFD